MMMTPQTQSVFSVATLGMIAITAHQPAHGDSPGSFRDMVLDGRFDPLVFAGPIDGQEWFDHFRFEITNPVVAQMVFSSEGETVCEGEFKLISRSPPPADSDRLGRITFRGFFGDDTGCPSNEDISWRRGAGHGLYVHVQDDLRFSRIQFREIDLDFAAPLDHEETERVSRGALVSCRLANWISPLIADPLALIECDLGRALDVFSEERLIRPVLMIGEDTFMRDGQLGASFEINRSWTVAGSYELLCNFDRSEAEALGNLSAPIFWGEMVSFDSDGIVFDCRVGTRERLGEYFGREGFELPFF